MLKAKQYNRFFLIAIFIGFFTYETYRMIFIPLPSQGGIFFYSNQHYPLQQVVARFLQQAQSSIWIECFMITDPHILQILKKKSRSIPIQLYHHRHHPSVFSSLDQVSITPSKRSGLMHKKLIMVDQKYLLIGSTNLTETSLLMHENVMIGFHCLEMGEAIAKRAPTYKNEAFQLYQLPLGKNAFIQDLLSLIHHAKKSIYVVMFCLSHEKIVNALHEAKERGLHVEVIIDGHTYDAGLDALFPVFRIKERHLMHHKFALIDESVLIFGSANWTKGGLSRNEELEMIITKAPEKILYSFHTLFKSLRKKSQPTIDQNRAKGKI